MIYVWKWLCALRLHFQYSSYDAEGYCYINTALLYL
jgi:hypothetical protein